jgi:hypothetical protein
MKGDYVVQADTVSRQPDLAVRVIDQEFRQIHVWHSREAGMIPDLFIKTNRAAVDEFVAGSVSDRQSFAFLLWEPSQNERFLR